MQVYFWYVSLQILDFVAYAIHFLIGLLYRLIVGFISTFLTLTWLKINSAHGSWIMCIIIYDMEKWYPVTQQYLLQGGVGFSVKVQSRKERKKNYADSLQLMVLFMDLSSFFSR
jgi:hypothetical protein